MLSGKKLEEFDLEGKKVVIRYPEMRDTEDLMNFVNSLAKEKSKIAMTEEIDWEEELEKHSANLKKIEKGERVQLVPEVGEKVVGSASVKKGKYGATEHTGRLALALKKEFRGKGLGSKLMELIISEAKDKLDIEILSLEVFENNQAAINLYKKFGFERSGKIKDGLKEDGEYRDKIIMERDLRD